MPSLHGRVTVKTAYADGVGKTLQKAIKLERLPLPLSSKSSTKHDSDKFNPFSLIEPNLKIFFYSKRKKCIA